MNYKNIKNKSYFDNFFEKKRLHDSKFWVKNGELLVDYINQTDDRRKAFLIGKVFSYCIEYEIDENIFFNLAFKINKSYYDDLNAISLFRDNKEIASSQDASFNLCTYGFLRNLWYDGGGASEESASGTIYQLNNFGEILLEVFKKTNSL